MVTIYKVEKSNIKEGKFLCEFRGLSTDNKPSSINNGDILNGSTFIEMDTQEIYFYDEENSEWVNPNVEAQSEGEN